MDYNKVEDAVLKNMINYFKDSAITINMADVEKMPTEESEVKGKTEIFDIDKIEELEKYFT